MMQDFAPACERNKVPILSVLRGILQGRHNVLEIGSGTGQHASYFSRHLPHVRWQPSDLPDQLASINAYRQKSGLSNLLEPIGLDLRCTDWPVVNADAVVCINCVHIVSWALVTNLFAGSAKLLPAGGVLFVYGPYRYSHRPLETSNENFDRWLKQRDGHSGIRDFDAVNELALQNGLQLENDRPMPANNRSIWWCKTPPPA